MPGRLGHDTTPRVAWLRKEGHIMGSRLVVAIRSETGWELYYDHWAAQTIGQDIAINGFEKPSRSANFFDYEMTNATHYLCVICR